MISQSPTMEEGLIYNVKLSSVGPGHVTSADLAFEPNNMDLAMKLHYIKGVYYFGPRAFDGLSTLAIKEPMFLWLNRYPTTCGRFRRAESGRAYVKCNDCGVRFIEAKCDKTLDEWLEMKDQVGSLEKVLCSEKCIGPELTFSPLIYIQLTKFKCGGTAVGLSWAHVLGDAFSASEYMNSLGKVVAGLTPEQPLDPARPLLTKPENCNALPKVVEDPLSIKRVGPVGDNWVNITKCKMDTFSFNVTPTQLSLLHSKLNGIEAGSFEAISAVIWKCIAKIRGEELEPRVVTMINKRSEPNEECVILSNSQVVSVVKAGFPVKEADPGELAMLMKNEAFDERNNIEGAMESEGGLPDFIVYGAKLTFVKFEDANFYDFDYRGEKPIGVSYRIDGVGEEGAILVLPGPKDGGKSGGGRSVIVILPENEIIGVKSELKIEGLMA